MSFESSQVPRLLQGCEGFGVRFVRFLSFS